MSNSIQHSMFSEDELAAIRSRAKRACADFEKAQAARLAREGSGVVALDQLIFIVEWRRLRDAPAMADFDDASFQDLVLEFRGRVLT